MYKIELQLLGGCWQGFGPFHGKSVAEEELLQAGFTLAGPAIDRWHLVRDGNLVAIAFVRLLNLADPSELAEVLKAAA